MAHHRRAATAPRLRTASKSVYSYLVCAIGNVEMTDLGKPEACISFQGRLAKKNGYQREHLVVAENSVEQQDLVERVRQALHVGVPARMLVSFERVMLPASDGLNRLQAIARIEEVVPCAANDDRQLTMAF